MSDILTLTGSKFKAASNARPALRLVRDGDQADAELLAPISNALFQIGAHAAKLTAMLGGDRDEALRLIEAELHERLGYVGDVA